MGIWGDKMKIYKVDLSKTLVTAQYLKSHLPNNCLSQANKYKVNSVYFSSLVAWYVLFEALRRDFNIDLSSKTIYYNEYNKPYIDGIYFNISHSENLVYVCISDIECGIDVQVLGKNNLLKHKDKILSISELSQIAVFDKIRQEEYITRIFSRKEAYLKMLGTGITIEGLNTLVDRDVVDLIITDDNNSAYVLSVAEKNIDISSLHIMEVDL